VSDDVWVLVVDAEQGAAGLAVEGFGARADVILRPLTGVLAGTAWYLGAALLGDGGVLLVLDVQALLR
jgi:two-component system chemotaxis sensor kinase CheA